MSRLVKTLQLEELKSLDLQKCASVGAIVEAMRYCAFGARMLGEVAATLCSMVAAGAKPLIIYDGLEDSSLGRLLQKFVAEGWCRRIVTPNGYARQTRRGDDVVVVGAFSERDSAAIFSKPGRALFI